MNTEQTSKNIFRYILEEIIIPYVKKERERLGMEKDQAALLIMDVSKGQMASQVLKVLPANFTYLFQPQIWMTKWFCKGTYEKTIY